MTRIVSGGAGGPRGQAFWWNQKGRNDQDTSDQETLHILSYSCYFPVVANL